MRHRKLAWAAAGLGGAALVGWLAMDRGSAESVPPPTAPASNQQPPTSSPPATAVNPAGPAAIAPSAEPPPPQIEASPQLRAACARLDDACRNVPLWSADDYEPVPRLRLRRAPGGALVEGLVSQSSAPWARCASRVLANAEVYDLSLPADTVHVECPASAHPRTDFLWHDREPFERTVRRCFLGAEETADLDAYLELVVTGDVLEVQNVEVRSAGKLDEGVRKCLELELASTRIRFAPEDRPGFDRLPFTFKADAKTVTALPPESLAETYALTRRGTRPAAPTDEQLARARQATTDFPENPYAFARLGAALAQRYRSTGDAAALAEARAAYGSFLRLARDGDPVAAEVRKALDESR
jgi:hypothetical protein